MCSYVDCSLVSTQLAASRFTVARSEFLPIPHPSPHVYSGNQTHVSSWVSANRGRVSRKSLDHYPTFPPTNPSIPRVFLYSLGLGINLGSAGAVMPAGPLQWHLDHLCSFCFFFKMLLAMSFSFFFFFNLFIYLFIFGCVGSSFLCKGSL